MTASRAHQAEVAVRRAELIRLRRKRVPYDSPDILNLGYETANDARKDFYRAVTARRKATEAEIADYREEQNVIFESILDSFLPLALGDDDNSPDHKAADVVLKTLERQAKVNGWEEALKAELSGPGGGPVRVRTETIAELRNLIRTAGDPDDDLDDDPDEEEESDDDSP